MKAINPNNIYTALADWLVLGQQAGFRRKEWAQDKTYLRQHNNIERNIDGSAAAFIISDFEFRAKRNIRINNLSKQEINKSYIFNLKWRFQKNNDNGQIISYVKNTANKQFCFVEAPKRIHHRTLNLKIPKDKPIAVFSETKKTHNKTNYIDNTHIKSILQETASKIYNIKCKKELSNFTSHSI